MKKNIIFMLLIGAIIFCLSGCNAPPTSSQIKDDGEVEYSTSNPMSSSDYSVYIGQESMTIINQLQTHSLMSLKVQKGEYPYADELKNAKSSLVIVEDAITNLTVTNPPAKYANTREDILRVMANTKSSLEAYIEALENKDVTAIKTAVSLMNADATSLTAFMNLDYN